MVVKIEEDIFLAPDFKGLNYLIQLLTYRSRYDLFVEIGAVGNTMLFAKLGSDDIELIEQTYNKVIQEGLEPSYTVTSTNTGGSYFNIEDAIRFFIQPVSIILENSLNDQYFLNSVIKFFDDDSKIEKYISNGWVQFENAGGCTNVENFLEGKLQAFITYPDRSKFIRAIVILDSDKKFPTDTTPEKYSKLIQYLVANGIKYHILEKRTMQNYMPDEALDATCSTPDLRAWFDAYRFLSQIQKDHLDYKNGFSKKDVDGRPTVVRSDLDQGVKDLFNDVSDANYGVLEKGIGIPSFKSNFPSLFLHNQVHRASLSGRLGTSEEFNTLIAMIKEYI